MDSSPQARRWSYDNGANFMPLSPPQIQQVQEVNQQQQQIEQPNSTTPPLVHGLAMQEVHDALTSPITPRPPPPMTQQHLLFQMQLRQQSQQTNNVQQMLAIQPLSTSNPPPNPIPITVSSPHVSCPVLPHLSDLFKQNQNQNQHQQQNQNQNQPHQPRASYSVALQEQRRRSQSRGSSSPRGSPSHSRSPSPSTNRDDFANAIASIEAKIQTEGPGAIVQTATQRSPSPGRREKLEKRNKEAEKQPKNLKWHQYVPAEKPLGVRHYPLSMINP